MDPRLGRVCFSGEPGAALVLFALVASVLESVPAIVVSAAAVVVLAAVPAAALLAAVPAAALFAAVPGSAAGRRVSPSREVDLGLWAVAAARAVLRVALRVVFVGWVAGLSEIEVGCRQKLLASVGTCHVRSPLLHAPSPFASPPLHLSSCAMYTTQQHFPWLCGSVPPS
jgi:hypothetical protein